MNTPPSVTRGRLSDGGPAPETGERFEALWSSGPVVVEHIVSSDVPGAERYVQTQDEWVVVLAGRASLEVDGARVDLATGDWLALPAGTPHRVLATEQDTRWLAVHVHPPPPAPRADDAPPTKAAP